MKRDGAGIGNLTAARQRLPALCVRPLAALATARGHGRHDPHAVVPLLSASSTRRTPGVSHAGNAQKGQGGNATAVARTYPRTRGLAQAVVGGFFAHHAVPTNGRALSAFYYYVKRIWLRTLRRRGQKDRFSWQRMHGLAADWLPQPRILHPYPDKRFAVMHPRWEPCAGIPPARIWAGGSAMTVPLHIEVFLIMNPLRPVANLTICCRPRRLRVVFGLKST